jgi:hypothetical protein
VTRGDARLPYPGQTSKQALTELFSQDKHHSGRFHTNKLKPKAIYMCFMKPPQSLTGKLGRQSSKNGVPD